MITKLTEAQEKLIPVYLKKWMDVGHRTVTIDQEKAKESADFLYTKILKRDKPKYYIFLDSPMMCQIAMNFLGKTPDQLDSQLRSQLRSQLDSQLDSQFRSQLDSQLGSQLDSQFGSQLGSQLTSQLDSQLYSQLTSQLGSQLYSQLGLQLGSQLGSQLYSQLYSQLGSQLDSQFGSQLGSQKMKYYYESLSNWYLRYYWFWTYDFILNEIFPEKVNQPEFKLFNEFMNHSKNIHCIYMCNDIVFLSDFPVDINKNSEGRLHNEKGMSLEYKDGYGMYSLNGITVTKEIALLKPEEITKDTILKQENADYRREIVRKLTPIQLLSILDPEVIDKKYGYSLLSIDLGDDRQRPFLKMTNPSIEAVHIEGVTPDCTTVEEAIEFRNGRPGLPITLDGFEVFTEYIGDYFQQGDCLFSIESELPVGSIKCDHNIAGDGLIRHIQSGGQLYEKDGIRYLVTTKEAKISHPEHKDTILGEGIYKISKVMEYDHFLNESREVID